MEYQELFDEVATPLLATKAKLKTEYVVALAAILVSSALAESKEKPDLLITKGTMKDPRDRTIYNTARLGTQTWMADNLDYRLGQSWCYDNNPSNCETYGRLYDWKTAKRACPAGWHLPSMKEWEELERTVGNEALSFMSQSMGGTDRYGFTVLPGGLREFGGVYGSIGRAAIFWSATGQDSGNAWAYFFQNGVILLQGSGVEKSAAVSVRCLRN
ncbi:MAG: hypothetical protein RL173_929 [Fibrobacterota bacterium]|jgi:uncharacterized protein (TIGR02145 family)